jgi:hypothetical protein
MLAGQSSTDERIRKVLNVETIPEVLAWGVYKRTVGEILKSVNNT